MSNSDSAKHNFTKDYLTTMSIRLAFFDGKFFIAHGPLSILLVK